MKNSYKGSSKRSKNNIFYTIRKMIGMNDLRAKELHVHFLPEIIYLTFLCVLYIGNRHWAERKIRDIKKLDIQVEDLRADYMTLKSEFMYESKQSKVAKRAKKLGLSESKQPPILIKNFEN